MKKPSFSGSGFWTIVVALILMSVSTLQALAATLSKKDGIYPYKVIGATMMSELFKLVASLSLLIMEITSSSGGNLRIALHATKRSIIMAAVPGISYQILNNLNFVTLYYVDAPTFQILGNLKIVATGLAGWLLLGRSLSKGKWLALTLLTFGAATSQISTFTQNQRERCSNNQNQLTESSSIPPAQIIIQQDMSSKFIGYISAITCVFLSASMGVFTEMYMKGNPASIHFQNLQLYFFGIFANIFALFFRDEIGPNATTSLLHGFNFWAWITVLTNGSCGLAVSFLLRYADSIAKTYSSCLAIPCTSIASFLFLSTPIGAPNIFGSGIMLISLAYYYFGESLFATTIGTKPSNTTADRAQAIVANKPVSSKKPSPKSTRGAAAGIERKNISLTTTATTSAGGDTHHSNGKSNLHAHSTGKAPLAHGIGT
uniref:EamA domain-containing protein n=1 Tax=Aureoumbra lagunensis TaxID=44058 RepID=A0A7S3K3L6_9STRA